MTKKALIIGGGIAGPVTSMALQKAGIESVVYEAYGHGSDGVGAFLTVAINGLEALRVLDLHDVVCDLGMATPRMRIRSGTGKVLAEFANPSRTLNRADLYEALRNEAVRRGISSNTASGSPTPRSPETGCSPRSPMAALPKATC